MSLDYEDERWALRRQQIFKRDCFECAACGSSEDIQCHHLKYGKTLWDVPDEWLITLCNECHSKYHDLLDRVRLSHPKIFFNKAHLFLDDEILVFDTEEHYTRKQHLEELQFYQNKVDELLEERAGLMSRIKNLEEEHCDCDNTPLTPNDFEYWHH